MSKADKPSIDVAIAKIGAFLNEEYLKRAAIMSVLQKQLDPDPTLRHPGFAEEDGRQIEEYLCL